MEECNYDGSRAISDDKKYLCCLKHNSKDYGCKHVGDKKSIITPWDNERQIKYPSLEVKICKYYEQFREN